MRTVRIAPPVFLRGVLLSLTIASALLVTPAHALFVNGGFENGTTGWTLQYGTYAGIPGQFYSWTTTLPPGHPEPVVIDASSPPVSGQTLDIDPYEGLGMLRMNDLDGGLHATRLSQTDVLTQADLDLGCLVIHWGAMLQDNHGSTESAKLWIDVRAGGAPFAHFETFPTSPFTGWTVAGSTPNGGLAFYRDGVMNVPLTALSVGTSITVEITVADCSVQIHGGCAFVDDVHVEFCLGQIQGQKYWDANCDGMRGTGEPGLQGWTIRIDGPSGPRSTTTDVLGNYVFSGVTPGQYTVSEDLTQSGWTNSTSQSLNVVVGNGQTVTGVDFGNKGTATISGMKFRDLNANGVNDGEPGLDAWTIQLDPPFGPITTTDANGHYAFCPPPGFHVVAEIMQPGWTITAPFDGSYAVSLTDGQQITQADFGNCDAGPSCCLARASHLVNGSFEGNATPGNYFLGLADAQRISGWTITQGDIDWLGTTWVASDGSSAIDLNGGQAGELSQDVPTTAGNAYAVSFDLAGNPQGGATVKTLDVSVTPGPTHSYSFDVSGHSITNLGWIREVFVFTASSPLTTLRFHSTMSGQWGPVIDHVAVRDTCMGEIRGRKYKDLDINGVSGAEPGVDQWPIDLSGPLNDNTTTLPDGSYAFTGLTAGTYTVCETQLTGWMPIAPADGCRTVTLGVDEVVNAQDFGNCKLEDCVKPPSGMVAWWPFDENTGLTVHDVFGPNTGAFVGMQQAGWAPGKVAGAASPIHQSPIRVPNDQTLNFAAGSFSIDAWVRLPSQTAVDRILVSKRTSTGPDIGYEMTVSPTALKLTLASGTTTVYSRAISLTNGIWYHVAAVVDHVSGVVSLYLDGNGVSQPLLSGNVSNNEPLYIGSERSVVFPIVLYIDELELFKKALTSQEIGLIYAAGPNGKCKDAYVVPSVRVFHENQSTLSLCFTLCNNDWLHDHTYAWNIKGLPVGPGCTVDGQTTFTPSSGIEQVAKGTCKPVCVTVTKPAGLGIGGKACYQVEVADFSLGWCSRRTGKFVVKKHPGQLVGDGGLMTVPRYGATPVSFRFSNDGPADSIRYSICAPPADADPANTKLALNGLAAGACVYGSIYLANGDSATVTVMASYPIDDVAFPMDEIVLALDTDRNGGFEPVEAGLIAPERVLTGVTAPACAPLPPGLVGWWRLDGDARDERQAHHGEVVDGPGRFLPAKVDSGYSPSGVGRLVRVPNAAGLDPTSFTLDAWARLDSITARNAMLVWKGNTAGQSLSGPFGLGVYGTLGGPSFAGRAFVTIGNGSSSQELRSLPVPVGSFFHLAATADGITLRLYFNGSQVAAASQQLSPLPSAFPLQIGGVDGVGAQNPGPAIIDQVELHNVAASADQIRDIYLAGPAGTCGDLVTAVPSPSADLLHFLGAVPNPLSGAGTFRFTIPKEGRVRLSVYDVAGRLVRRVAERMMAAGNNAVAWDGLDASGNAVPIGIYLARLETSSGMHVARFVVVR